MSKKYFHILLLLTLIAALVLVAGCTQPTPTSTATPKPTISKGIQLFDQSKFHMYVYKIFATDGKVIRYVGNLKAEYDTKSYGDITNARHMLETRVMGQGNETVTTVTELYFNPANNLLLGGHANVTSASGVEEKDIAATDINYWNADISVTSPDAEFINEGRETMTVPKDVYSTTKYTSTESGITVWLARDIPVPIKIAGSGISNGVTITTSMELLNYA